MTILTMPSRPPLTITIEVPEFRLYSGEPLAVGAKRLSLDQIEQARAGFFDGEELFSLAVHESRKATKRLRALLRLVRFEVGEKAYPFENAWFRDTARMLSGVRTSYAVVESMSQIQQTYEPLLAEGVFEETLERLNVRRARLEQRVMEDPVLVNEVVSNFDRAYERFMGWPTSSESKPAYGIGIRNSFDAVAPGLRRTFHRGRREMVMAYRVPTATNFHAWRKRVKYLRYQMEILTPIWPEVVLAMALAFERVGELLGEDHDLAELLSLLADRPDLCPNPVERSLVKALAQQRRSDLQEASRILGKRLFAENPTSLTSRLESYWESAAEPLPESLRMLVS